MIPKSYFHLPYRLQVEKDLGIPVLHGFIQRKADFSRVFKRGNSSSAKLQGYPYQNEVIQNLPKSLKNVNHVILCRDNSILKFLSSQLFKIQKIFPPRISSLKIMGIPRGKARTCLTRNVGKTSLTVTMSNTTLMPGPWVGSLQTASVAYPGQLSSGAGSDPSSLLRTKPGQTLLMEAPHNLRSFRKLASLSL